jgi:hypothetical protein
LSQECLCNENDALQFFDCLAQKKRAGLTAPRSAVCLK